MKWLALLLYVVLVLRLSNVADLRLLPLTPLLRFPLVEVEEHLEALLWWSEPGTAEAVVQHAIVTECRQGRIPWSQLLSFSPALGLLLRQWLAKLSPDTRFLRDSHASLESQEVDPMRFPRNSHASLESQEVDPMRFPARGKVVSGILNKLKIHEFPRRNHDFACFPLSSAASTLLARAPGLNPRKKHYIQHVSNP